MAGKYWREAASLMVVGRAAHVNTKVTNKDFNLLFLKRSKKSSFLPNSYVFPGGVIEPSDFSQGWMDVFEKCGYKPSDLLKEFRYESHRPSLYNNKPSHYIMPEVGFRIGAIRETFEESGLLLANHLPDEALLQDQVSKWRKIVHQDASQFLTLFQEVGGCPAVSDLHEWITWLTPTFIGSRRFDTVFYIAFLDTIPTTAVDAHEIEDIQVCSPLDMMEQCHNQVVNLAPPQYYELSRLLNFATYDQLKTFAVQRGNKGMDHYFPVRIVTKNGILVCLPGDDLYPEEPDYSGEGEVIVMENTLEELRASARRLHRMENKGKSDIKVLVTFSPKYGQMPPLDVTKFIKSSKL